MRHLLQVWVKFDRKSFMFPYFVDNIGKNYISNNQATLDPLQHPTHKPPRLRSVSSVWVFDALHFFSCDRDLFSGF